MRAILWDMDGTLIDSEPAHEAAFNDVIAELGITVPSDFHDRVLGASAQEVHRTLLSLSDITLTFDEWVARKWHHFQRHAASIQRRRPVAALAQRLQQRGVPMAVVSNSTAEEVEIGLRVTGLDKVITLQISREDVERGKPSPEGYLLAAQRLGVSPQDCMVVEDSLIGSTAGRAAAMTVLYHPQIAASDPAILPQGLIYLPPDAIPDQTVEHFLDNPVLA